MACCDVTLEQFLTRFITSLLFESYWWNPASCWCIYKQYCNISHYYSRKRTQVVVILISYRSIRTMFNYKMLAWKLPIFIIGMSHFYIAGELTYICISKK